MVEHQGRAPSSSQVNSATPLEAQRAPYVVRLDSSSPLGCPAPGHRDAGAVRGRWCPLSRGTSGARTILGTAHLRRQTSLLTALGAGRMLHVPSRTRSAAPRTKSV